MIGVLALAAQLAIVTHAPDIATACDALEISVAVSAPGGVPPTPRGDMARLASLIPQMTNVLDTESTNTGSGGEDDSANSSGPFLGVASRSKRNSVMTYYGIDHHDGWLFTPLFR